MYSVSKLLLCHEAGLGTMSYHHCSKLHMCHKDLISVKNINPKAPVGLLYKLLSEISLY